MNCHYTAKYFFIDFHCPRPQTLADLLRIMGVEVDRHFRVLYLGYGERLLVDVDAEVDRKEGFDLRGKRRHCLLTKKRPASFLKGRKNNQRDTATEQGKTAQQGQQAQQIPWNNQRRKSLI